MPLATLLPMIGSLLVKGVDMFAGNNDKLQKISDIAAGALGRIPAFVDSVKEVFDGLGGRDLEVADFDALIAKIDANTSRIDQLDQDAQARDAD